MPVAGRARRSVRASLGLAPNGAHGATRPTSPRLFHVVARLADGALASGDSEGSSILRFDPKTEDG